MECPWPDLAATKTTRHDSSGSSHGSSFLKETMTVRPAIFGHLTMPASTTRGSSRLAEHIKCEAYTWAFWGEI